MHKKTRAFLKILTAFFIWSLYGPILNLSSFTPMQNSFWSGLLTIAFIFLYLAYKSQLKDLKKIKINRALIVFLLASGLTSVLWFNALTLLPLAQALLLMSTITIFSTILGYLILRENIYLAKIIAILLGISGVTIILSSNLANSSSRDTFLLGTIVTLVAAFCGALQVVIARKFSFQYPNIIITLMVTLAKIVIASLFAFRQNLIITPFAISGVVFLSIFMGIIAFFFYIDGLREYHSSSVRLIGYIEVFLATIWGYIFLKQTLSLEVFIGGIIILLAGLLIAKVEKNMVISQVEKTTTD